MIGSCGTCLEAPYDVTLGKHVVDVKLFSTPTPYPCPTTLSCNLLACLCDVRTYAVPLV